MPYLSKTARPQISAVSLPANSEQTGSQLAPFAVVVYQIFVDSGGYFFVPFAALGLFQRHGMDHTAFQLLQP